MKTIWLKTVLLACLLLGLAACVPSATQDAGETALTTSQVEQPTATAIPATPAAKPAGTIRQTEDGYLFSSEAGGYSFVYPEGYCWLAGQDASTNTFVNVDPVDIETMRCPDEPLILHGDVVWVGIHVSQTNEQSLDDVRANMAEMIEDFDLDVEEVTLAGETAVQINNMPGQDISRQVTAVHDDQRYELTFVPAGANALYAQVTASFQFLP